MVFFQVRRKVCCTLTEDIAWRMEDVLIFVVCNVDIVDLYVVRKLCRIVKIPRVYG